MTEPAILAFGSSALVLILLWSLTYYEYVSGRRFLRPIRVWFDQVILTVARRFDRAITHITRYVLQLGWYYSIHSILRAVLLGLVKGYHALEAVFERNRARTKALRRELKQQKSRTHLDEIHDHKTSTALSDSEKRRLRKRGL